MKSIYSSTLPGDKATSCGTLRVSEDLLLAWKAIHWVALAARPLTLLELQFALAIETTST